MPFLRVFFVSAAAVLLAFAAGEAARSGQDEEPPRVLAVEFANDVNPVTEEYLVGAIERGERERYDAVVILTDTPGGLASSMRAIIKAELAAKVPVVLYVAPPGASADSAGAFLAMAADVAAMAPQTNIGSSTPVNATGEDIPDDLRTKIVNDAAAYIRELAEEHGRNGDLAENFVREGTNIGAREALEEDVVDVIAPDLPTLLEEIDGMRTEPKGLVLETAGARIETVEMSFWKDVLDTLVDPNLIVLLMTIGLLGLTVEILSPGLIFPGTIGAISLVIGLFGLQVLPISWAGILLMLLAAGFFAAELFVPSHGALTLAGGVTFAIGALMLFDPAGPAYQVSIEVAVGVAATLAIITALAVTKIVQVRRRPVEVGVQSLVGTIGEARRDEFVLANGELWRARTPDGERLAPGQRVTVEHVEDGLVLDVRPLEEAGV